MFKFSKEQEEIYRQQGCLDANGSPNINPAELDFINVYKQKLPIKSYYTLQMAVMMCGMIATSKIKSYLELGCGYGGILTMAGLAISHNGNPEETRIVGVDMKENRLAYAEKMVNKAGLKNVELIHSGAGELDWNEEVDLIFIDTGHTTNQAMIDKYGKYVKKAIVAHDVTGKLILPPGFDALYIKRSPCMIAYKSDIF